MLTSFPAECMTEIAIGAPSVSLGVARAMSLNCEPRPLAPLHWPLHSAVHA